MPRKSAQRPKNANGEGTISFEKDRKKWRALIYDPEGNRLRKRFDTESEAKEWLILKKAEFTKGTYIPPSNMTYGEWLIEYIKTYREPKLREKSAERLWQTAAHLAPLSNTPLQDIEPFAIQKFYLSLSENMANSGKKKIHQLVISSLKKAFALKLISDDVTLPIEAPNYNNETDEVEVFTIDEVQRIFQTISVSRYYKKYYSFILLAATTGARLGELLGLKRNCVMDGYIRINNSLQEIRSKLVDMPPKTKRSNRDIAIPESVEKNLRDYMFRCKIIPMNGYVFHTRKGGPLAPRNMERVWKSILREAGVLYKKFHTLRHTHATQLLADGVPVTEVSKRLGHSSPDITLRIYAHAIPKLDTAIVVPAVERLYKLPQQKSGDNVGTTSLEKALKSSEKLLITPTTQAV